MDYLDALIIILILGLGTARATALITLDDITEPLRDRIFHRFPPEDNDARGWYYQSYRPAISSERRKLKELGLPAWKTRWEYDGNQTREASFIGRLLGCHKCVGVWVAAANTLLLYASSEVALFVNTILATAFVSIMLIGRNWR